MVDGILRHHCGFESCREHPDFHFELSLEGGLKQVTVYFPCLTRIDLSELDFHSAKTVRPVEKKRKMLCYGDSITQGYDARHHSLTYPNRLADAFETEMFNKAIGGDRFNPALAAALHSSVRPDLITVAYGTNDWSHSSRENFASRATAFYEALAARHPGVPIYAFLPLWRKDHDRETAVGRFEDAGEIIRQACAPYPQIRVEDGWNLIPHQESCFSPDGLHPNDSGFRFMASNLLTRLPVPKH